MPTPHSIQAYCQRLGEFISAPVDGGFEERALALFRAHMEVNPVYRRFCEKRGLSGTQVKRWQEIPAVPTAAFKELELTWLSPSQRRRVFHSSGTSGAKPSRHFHNEETLALYEAALWPPFHKHVLAGSAGPFFYLALTPPPQLAPTSSLAHMFGTVERLSSGSRFAYLARLDAAGAWEIDRDLAWTALQEAQAQKCPVVLLGPAFAYVQWIEALGTCRVPLPCGSRAMETGGYKGRSRALSKEQLRGAIRERFGLGPEHVIGEYGMSELSSQAYDGPCGKPRGSFQFASTARSLILSPETGEEVADGEVGLIRVVDLANVSSAPAVQTEDLAIRRGAGFEWIGRAAGSAARGCSLRMSDVV